MKSHTTKKAKEFLHNLVDKPLCYGIKLPELDLYEFGFGDSLSVKQFPNGTKEVCMHTLHITCRFKIIPRKGGRAVSVYHEYSLPEKFQAKIKELVGLKIKRVALSQKNDLWLDLGDYWMVFATSENGEESWRLFLSDGDAPHLVAANSWLDF